MEIRELIEKLADKYPLGLQESWDNSGLQVGNPNNELKNILISLDLEDEGVDKAIENGCNLIITHHPYLFSPAKSIDLSKHFYKRLEKLIKNDISLYSFHTNLDIAYDGLNDNLARILNIKNTRVLEEGEDPGLGRYGFIEEVDAKTYINFIKKTLKAEGLVVYGDIDKKISKVAVCGGSGGELIDAAINRSCQMIVTADVRYHDGMDKANEGIIIVDPGHFASENHVTYKLEEEVKNLVDTKVFTYSKEDSFRKIF
ncbi:MAG: Nif3-like dinuclear metal center hexameric protein [Anaerococcus sp.]|nr:Nif3-like dinuclear metal center hexameric protein [Anaerococcus sp.]